ncbi:MAG: non-canonical purine NTP pyrophosphatase, RdgB/HAM1 family [Cobetia sp.]|jgi:XTP/dITP diphosphohydrolase|uniref:dITP/XTP pyrophosphatase n=1 Tax=Cobetia amphilecti TaxID=1055104 RepID=A0AAP4WY69_9GAMM|nr:MULTISPECIES: RdgB/HAM1 family non-canonical purine NTP pyrophosphatase [Cobetia]TCJ24509.1 RdgB/HAM1 family non-canonical purine NTP pyrophosphatase [Halomonas sp. GDM18]MBF09457.1 non-canonical purine NTP pyrophosphatase, RdgB/HAM1 family [Cobetia sp.]MBK08834.1 non-canonical purine NTP pyrophosphatase, RdgB/HAM1 family [Cobetia sp.]MBS4154048.1 RdgB/HAM1 family non-canonical purine NTP pyrophosphatase [Cobetia sp. MC34]MBU3008853.1 RdgB/HAM1 family non-canonical purine NTP pyrophosphatas|tara:strand:- start:69690 stop:70310 length:621 start_codon:yes stop_codon:yes gene_type:complete
MSASSLVLASGNAGKLREFSHLLAPLGIEPMPQGQLGVSDAEETGLTFVENALIKARHAAEVTGLPALADDSGIEVDALGGEPGIYSARFAARRQQGSGDGDNNAALLAALEGVPEQARTARYWCVLVYLRHAADPVPIIVQASWEGRVLDAPQGEGGFGYDPLFWLPEHGMTAAALDAETKNRLSHRGRAMQQLLEALAAQSGQA